MVTLMDIDMFTVLSPCWLIHLLFQMDIMMYYYAKIYPEPESPLRYCLIIVHLMFIYSFLVLDSVYWGKQWSKSCGWHYIHVMSMWTMLHV